MHKTWITFTLLAVAALAFGFTKDDQRPAEPLNWEDVGAFVSLDEAKAMTDNFTDTYDGVRSLTFSKAPMREFLDQDGLKGVRVYYARYPDTQEPTLVLVGVDEFGDDRLDWIGGPYGKPCPIHCDESSTAAGKVLSLEQATSLTSDFQVTRDGVRAHLYSAAKIRTLLDDEAVGLRIYYAESEGPRLVLLGVDGDGKDRTNFKILDWAEDCPPLCPTGLQ